MKSSKRQVQRRQALYLTALVALMGLVWSMYEWSTSISANPAPSRAQSGEPRNDSATLPDSSPRFKIVIDPGHGGKDPGAEGASGKREHLYTLSLATKVFDLLREEPQFEPYMTRTDDTFIELGDRAKLANDLGADAFVSIHGNTYTEPNVSGTESYYYDDDSKPLADEVHKQLAKTSGFQDRGVKRHNWQVLRESENLAILLEVGFLTNPNEEAQMLTEAHQNRTAQAIVDGIKNYFATQFDPGR